jgi:hypothetical protein
MEITKTKSDSFVINTKQVDVAINPTDTTKAEVLLFSKTSETTKSTAEQIVFDGAGEYEVKNTMIDAVACEGATAFVVTAGTIRLTYIDNEQPQLSEDQIEDLGGVDILVIKVFGEKIEVITKLISDLEPNIVIPFGYTDTQLKQLAAEFGKEVTTVSKLKLSKKDINPEDQQLVVLE